MLLPKKSIFVFSMVHKINSSYIHSEKQLSGLGNGEAVCLL
jgi:hypothetical protein